MKCYKPEKVNKDLPGIILLSHGPFAVSLVDTAKMLFGESENIAAYSLEPGDDIDKYREAFVETINEFPEGSMILVDLFGGTPCNQVMRHIQETEKPLEVVGGMNLPMLVNAVLAREGMSGKDFSLDTVENGKNGIFRVDTEGFLSDDEDEDEDEEEFEQEERILSKKDILKSYLVYWFTAEICHSFERMQAPGFCAALVPALKKFYPNKEDKPHYIEALKRNMTFFNTEAHWGGGPCLGLTLAMEEKKSRNYDAIPGEMIVNLKTGLMGPLAGIGDTISWSTLMYLFIGLFLPLAKQGNPLGGIGPIVLLTVICFGIGYFLTSKCYTFGYSFAENMLKSGLINMIITGASILGLFMMGGLAATYVTVSTPIKFATSTYTTTLQSILNSIAPGILPLIVVLCIWGYLAKVKRNYFAATLGVTIISLVLGCIGVII